jgi:hypothetical protein
MTKLAADTVRLSSIFFGVPLDVQCRRVDSAAVREHLRFGCEERPEGVRTKTTFALGTSDGRLFSVLRRSSVRASDLPLEAALHRLQKEVYVYVAEHSQDRVFIHAGVVAVDGKAVVLPGKSHAGKSTLVWALVRAGATYYSDEYAVFDRKGEVYLFRCPWLYE